MSHRSTPRPIESLAGTVFLVGGVALALLVVAVRLEGLWSLRTSLIQRNPVMLLGISLVLVLGGAKLLWQTRTVATTWAPSRPGRRFQSLVLFKKDDCPLCDEAASVLATYHPYLPPVQTVDVLGDPALQSQYAGCVPVVEIDGRKRFVGQVSEVLLRRLIEGTAPATE